jgi:hypothetical protein
MIMTKAITHTVEFDPVVRLWSEMQKAEAEHHEASVLAEEAYEALPDQAKDDARRVQYGSLYKGMDAQGNDVREPLYAYCEKEILDATDQDNPNDPFREHNNTRMAAHRER